MERIIVRQSGKLDWAYIQAQLRPLAELKGSPETMELLACRRVECEQ